MTTKNKTPEKNIDKMNLLEIIRYKLNKRKENRENLTITLDEQVKYKELFRDQPTIPVSILLYPFYLIFYLGLFVIITNLAFGIDFKLIALLIISLGLKLWPAIILAILVTIGLEAFSNSRHNRRLVKEIIKQRSNK